MGDSEIFLQPTLQEDDRVDMLENVSEMSDLTENQKKLLREINE